MAEIVQCSNGTVTFRSPFSRGLTDEELCKRAAGIQLPHQVEGEQRAITRAALRELLGRDRVGEPRAHRRKYMQRMRGITGAVPLDDAAAREAVEAFVIEDDDEVVTPMVYQLTDAAGKPRLYYIHAGLEWPESDILIVQARYWPLSRFGIVSRQVELEKVGYEVLNKSSIFPIKVV